MQPRPSDNSHGGRPLEDEEELRRLKKARSASGELDGPLNEPQATLFEEVDEQVSLPVFEPVSPDEPHVEWETEEDHEIAEERFEALVDELFTVLDDPEDQAVFEEVLGSLGWSEGEVIWEGMDFDQMFTDPGEFHDFELLSRREQRKFLRDRLRTQQASFGVEASDEGEVEMEMDHRPKGRRQSAPEPPKPRSPGQLVSYETETEHRPEDLDIGMHTGREKRRKRR
ncbi:MAG: hypothetical protein GWN18_01750 [Thermoplasmata archaeon]|nr:hypothetical protein [Thermoplasmata archaeon]NIS10730.1 hypothetical protein [Thermoplasmata archaeon]NIS18670.1 hypothetical protein [Thermoplasmata archaeon]NIT75680.1 hypothetical protein [Thermoplasmata archaeon]NIU47831.1 hypothetical protein [Thermoplasmata archaeon]